MESKSKQLRSGYTTGACAAAAAKAAAVVLWRKTAGVEKIEIPFPDGSRILFAVQGSQFRVQQGKDTASASIIKDAGDDPDITNGAVIMATVQLLEQGTGQSSVIIKGGTGVGRVTKPGLAIPVGEPAINPVPRRMINGAVLEAVREAGINGAVLEVTISVPDGETLAKKTLNDRLGIVGGISILGTTGIVKPLSESAWTATITASFDVAKALGLEEVVVSTGRTSEKAHQKKYGFPAEAYAMMGDFTEFSLHDAKKHGFQRIHVCAQWAKMVKIAMETPHTHVRHGALEAETARDFLIGLGIELPRERTFNTTREIYDHIRSAFPDSQTVIEKVCNSAKAYCEKVTAGTPVIAHLVSYEGEILAESK